MKFFRIFLCSLLATHYALLSVSAFTTPVKNAVLTGEASVPADATLTIDGTLNGTAPAAIASTAAADATTKANAAQAAAIAAAATDATAKVLTETTRATTAEGVNATAITAEASTRAAADTTHTTNIATNASAISTETSRATAAEATKAALDLSGAASQIGVTSAVAPLAQFTGAMAQAATYVASGGTTTARRVNAALIGDSTGGDLFSTPYDSGFGAWLETYGFGGIQRATNNYDGVTITSSGVTQTDDRTKWFLSHSVMAEGAWIIFQPDIYAIPQSAAPTTYSYVSLSGVRVWWIKAAGSFKIQYSVYAAWGDAAYTTPTWVDGATVDTSTGSTPVQKTDVTFPVAGLYRVRILQTAGTPAIGNWGMLGINGLYLDRSAGAGSQYLSQFLASGAATWSAYLAATAPDLITIQFKNNGGDTIAAWETQMRTLLGYILAYAPQASVVLVGNYDNSAAAVGGQMSMAQQRAFLRALAAENDGLKKTYIDANEVMGGSYAAAASAGLITDGVHATALGQKRLGAHFIRTAGLFTPLDARSGYAPKASGVTAGTYTTPMTVTVDLAGRVTSAAAVAATQSYYSSVATMDVSAQASPYVYTPVASDDGKIYLVTTGSVVMTITPPNTGTGRDGFNVSFVKADTGSGRISNTYLSAYTAHTPKKGDGLQLIQNAARTTAIYRPFSIVWASDGSGSFWRALSGAGAPSGGAAGEGWLYTDTTNHKLYYCTAGSNSSTWAKLLTSAGEAAIASGKTLTVSNTLTLTATDGSTLAIGTGGTLGTAAYTAATAYATAAQGTKADNAGAITGLIKSNGGATFAAAVAGTDYVAPAGNVATATALATPRTINGVSFDGSANITIPAAVVAAPASATSTGTAGTFAYDATHVYVCIATDTWVRADLATW